MSETQSIPSPIPWHRRMEARVVLGLSLLIGLSLAAVLTETTRVVTTRSLERTSEELEAARSAFYQLVANRGEFASAQTRLITALPVFRAHMTDTQLASDLATLNAMADEYRRELRAEFCIVTDRDGTWIGTPGWSAVEKPRAILAGIEEALAGRPRRDIASIDGRLFLITSEPAQFAQETLGTLTAGYLLDDAIAEELAKITRSEVILFADSGPSGSSLPGAARTELASAFGAENESHAGAGILPGTLEVGGVRYVAGAFSLFPDRTSEGVGRLVLLHDWAPTLQFLDQLRGSLLLTGIATFGLTVTGGFLFSRRVSEPFKDIAEAAGDLASGNWSREVPIRGSAEAMTMATSFNQMSSHLRHWHDQAEQRETRLQASYERFHSVTESARDGIVSTNGEGTITFWNRSAGVIFGSDEETALGMALTSFIAKPDWLAYRDALTFACADRSQSGRTIELTGVRQDGTQCPVELSLSASRTDAASQVTAVVRDATERKKAEAQLRDREAELRQAQKLEAIGLLAGGVAHDFNNVLTAIVGYGELVMETLDKDDSRRSDVREILDASARAAGLTRQLLAFSRRQVLQPRVLDLDAIVANTRKMLGRIIGEDITLSSATGPALGRVKADPGQIEQVLINLAVNARDAMRDGGTIHIALSNTEVTSSPPQGLPPGRYVLLAVSDTGCGMSPEIAARIFEPFFTTKGEGQGTGLGLSMVYGIVQQSGGSIEVESHVGRGTTFRIYLPLCVETEQAAATDAAPQRSVRGSETVLLAEDDDHVRSLVATMLRQQGYSVLDASDGEQALALAQSHPGPIDLLLTDVVMPNMSGRVLAEHLRTIRPSTRLLFMSGYSDDAILRAGIQAQGTIFIEKPFSKDVLTARIREVLQGPVAVW